MTCRKKYTLLLVCMQLLCFSVKAQPGLIISEILANPSGTDSPFEFVELVASQNIDFSTTPYTIVACNNGTANANGWITGNALSYAFQINTGTVTKGDVVYVGGSSIVVSGAKLRTINTGTTAGDGSIGNAASGGVFGNGGANADGIAVFNLSVSSITSSSVPVDAVFYGTSVGTALVTSGTAGYQLPVNDLYSGGKLQTTSFLGPDPASAAYMVATGTYNVSSQTFTTSRTFTSSSSFTDNTTSITLTGGVVEELAVSPSSLSFTSLVNDTSDVKMYTLSGTALTSDVELTTTSPFELSKTAIGPFSTMLTVASADAISGTTIYVRYRPEVDAHDTATVHHVSGTAIKELDVYGRTLELTPIYSIQGISYSSTLINQTVVTEGIVTADFQTADQLKGFFLQDETGDGDALTSDGIFVYDNLSAFDVTKGDKVKVYGTVKESYGRTQIESVSNVVVVSSNNTLVPVSLMMPATTTLESREAYEGMLVKLTSPLYVSENYDLGRYGEVLLAKDSFLINPTNYIDPNDDPASGTSFYGTSNLSAIKTQMKVDSLRSILLDDASDVENPAIVPFIDNVNHTLRTGSSFAFDAAILDYDFGAYRLEPVEYTITYAQRPDVPQFANANIIAASQNVLNYFNGDGLGGGFPTARGANNLTELQRQSEKLYAALYAMNADAVGLMEMENDGDDNQSAVHTFTAGLNQYIQIKTGVSDTYTHQMDPSFIGSDAIKCAMIYKSSKLEPIGDPYTSNNAYFSRPPIAQVFHVLDTDQKFLFVVNHFKSKGCTDATGNDLDQNDGQSCYNEKRKNQAGALVTFINETLTATSIDKVLSVGDYNAYEEEDPIDELRASGLINLISHSYSFVFDGTAGSLDHGFVNTAMHEHVIGAEKWHINALEPRLLDYNTEFNPAYVYQNNPYRCSDHDGLLVGLKFENNTVTAVTNGKSADETLTLFPNPSDGNITLSATHEGDAIKVSDVLGNIVWEGQAKEVQTTLNLAHLPLGMYMVNCNGHVIKMIKK